MKGSDPVVSECLNGLIPEHAFLNRFEVFKQGFTMPFPTIKFFSPAILLLFVAAVRAESDPLTVEACYQQQDKACLEAIYQDIVTNKSPEKLDAMYYLGLIYLEEGDDKAAKRQFDMAEMFGDGQRSTDKQVEIILRGNIEAEPRDCFKLPAAEQCLLDIANSTSEKADVAYFFLAGALFETEPERAGGYAIKAAEMGHSTAQCLLAAGYAHEPVEGVSVTAGYVPFLPKDYEKSRYWGEKCGSGPFQGYSKKHFKKYQAAEGHKAYVRFGPKYRNFEQGAATAEIAVKLAGELCRLGTQDRKENLACQIVNVDDQWVDFFVAEPLPQRTGAYEDLLKADARHYFKTKYKNATGPKVFVQGPLGNWSARYGSADQPFDAVIQDAINACQKSWRSQKYSLACEVINKNGEWLN